ncbi:MAG TPA: NfeD family protein [Gemmatimonadales bacterium]|nr:NfeD family protein [Gemmatimonadales bacterium]
MRRFLLLPVLALAGVLPVAGAAAQEVHRVPVHGTIENGLAPFVIRALAEARAAGAAAVLLDIDTPGGRIDAAQRIVDAVRRSEVPVHAWVHPRAFSAGAFIALAAKEIWIEPGGVIGAATPVGGQGEKLPEKYVSAMRAEFRALAEARGLDPRIAEAMVDEDVAVPGVVDSGRLLTLSADEAVRHGVATGQAATLEATLEGLGLAGAPVVTPAPNWAEKVVRFVTHPVVSPLLLSLGILGLIFEIKAGAFGLGGLVSVASLGLFFGSSAVLGLAGMEEVILLVLGLVALGIEAFVLPGFGVAGAAGILLVGGSAILAMLGHFPGPGDVTRAFVVLGAAGLITAAVVYAWLRHLPYSPRFRRALLVDGLDASQGYVAALPRAELVGREGTAVTDLRPSGTILVDDERIDAVAESGFVTAGSAVRVIRAEGYRHVVRPVA